MPRLCSALMLVFALQTTLAGAGESTHPSPARPGFKRALQLAVALALPLTVHNSEAAPKKEARIEARAEKAPLSLVRGPIDVSRLKEIAVLVTDKGPDPESIHGHAAMRFMYGDRPSASDFVANFVADVPPGTSAAGDFFRGTGIAAAKYPSQVLPGNYRAFYSDYSHQHRGVTTYVLKLTPEIRMSIASFVNSELNAGHASKDYQILYYNCAVMVMEAINAGFGNSIGRQNMPDRLGATLAPSIRQTYYDPAH